MKVIYEPRGAAREYAPLAVNLYTGCIHGCRYCYAPACLRKSAEAFGRDVRPRKDILKHLAADCRQLPRGAGPVLLCFSCDPYQRIDGCPQITEEAILMLAAAGARIKILTKDPWLGLRIDLLKQCDVEFGVSLAWANQARLAEWEPRSASVQDRLGALAFAKSTHVRTWASIEPVIDAGEALTAIRLLVGKADYAWVGKVNHRPYQEAKVDWQEFRRNAEAVARDGGLRVYFKKSLEVATK